MIVNRWIALILLGPLIMASCGALSRTNSEDRRKTETDEIRHLVANYAKSIDDADTVLASTVWETSPDVSFIHPGGHEHGWEEVKRNIYERSMRDIFSERKLSVRDIAVRLYGDAAVAEFYWQFLAKLRKEGTTLETNGRETQVFHRSPGGRWRLVHVHYSAMPVVRTREGF